MDNEQYKIYPTDTDFSDESLEEMYEDEDDKRVFCLEIVKPGKGGHCVYFRAYSSSDPVKPTVMQRLSLSNTRKELPVGI